MPKVFKFDSIYKYQNDDDFNGTLTRDGYTLSLIKTINSTAGIHIAITDDTTHIGLFAYTKWYFGMTPVCTLKLHQCLSHKTNEEDSRDTGSLVVDDNEILVLSLRLEAYKSKKNENPIPKELIDTAYELLITLNNNKRFTIEGRKQDGQARHL